MVWGFYCRTCGESSQGWYEEFTSLVRSFQESRQGPGELTAGGSTRAQAPETGARSFLALHSGHEIWAESETGVLRLSQGDAPADRAAALPHRFVSGELKEPRK